MCESGLRFTMFCLVLAAANCISCTFKHRLDVFCTSVFGLTDVCVCVCVCVSVCADGFVHFWVLSCVYSTGVHIPARSTGGLQTLGTVPHVSAGICFLRSWTRVRKGGRVSAGVRQG